MARELADRVWQLELRAASAYLVQDRELLLFDAGTPGSSDTLVEEIRETGNAVGDVDRVLVTHYDLDHVGGLAGLTPELDAPVLMREPDASYLTGTEKPGLLDLKGLVQRVTAYHTPGHTRGHMAYVSERRDVGVLGDLVRETGGRLERSPRYLSEDTDAVRESVETLATRAPGFEVAAVGHGDLLTERGHDELVRLARS